MPRAFGSALRAQAAEILEFVDTPRRLVVLDAGAVDGSCGERLP
jgi:hypothetical protein